MSETKFFTALKKKECSFKEQKSETFLDIVYQFSGNRNGAINQQTVELFQNGKE